MVDQAEIHRKTVSFEILERRWAVEQLRTDFADLPDREEAWKDLHRLTQDEYRFVRWGAANALGSAFQHIPDKEEAWKDLHRLTLDEDLFVRWSAADALGSAFQHIPDREEAWKDLHQLTHDEDNIVRSGAAGALGSVFQHVPDKEEAWKDLHQLTRDEDSWVRTLAAGAFGSAFQHVPDKEEAWKDLRRLTQDKDSYVRSRTYYSIGRINILEASEANEGKIKKYLDAAIENFDKSIKERSDHNPAVFCTLFYKSYSTILFKPEQTESEAKKFIEEAKKTSEGSESKAELLEAVENLALREADRYKTLDERQRDLRAHMKHLDRVAEIIEKYKTKAPIASMLLEHGRYKTEERINVLILEIQEKAKAACEEARGKTAEELACTVSKETQKWRIGDHKQMTRNVENVVFSLKAKIPPTPENKHICDKIEEIRNETDLTKQYEMLPFLIALIPTTNIQNTGDTINLPNITASGKSQVIVKGDKNKNIDLSVSPESNTAKKSLIDRVNGPATFAAFLGFVISEIGTYFYPVTYNHLISVFVFVLVFVLVALFNKR